MHQLFLSVRRGLLPLVFLLLGGYVNAQQGYEMVSPPQPTETGDKIEVIEFFWYGCPHCFAFEPHIDDWVANKKPDNVEFRLVAPPLNASWTNHSRAYYAAELLGVVDKFHTPLFEAIHKKKQRLFSEDQLVGFAGSVGIDETEFRDAMRSFAVDTKVRRANQMARDYRIDGVPTVAINGKYKTSGSLAGNYPNLIQILDQLIAAESSGG